MKRGGGGCGRVHTLDLMEFTCTQTSREAPPPYLKPRPKYATRTTSFGTCSLYCKVVHRETERNKIANGVHVTDTRSRRTRRGAQFPPAIRCDARAAAPAVRTRPRIQYRNSKLKRSRHAYYEFFNPDKI
ncbi:hypothetical protein ACJJTC_011976 [Scirpophaga incertulas]